MTQEQDARARVCSRRVVADFRSRIVISSRGGYPPACTPAEIGATVRSYALKTPNAIMRQRPASPSGGC